MPWKSTPCPKIVKRLVGALLLAGTVWGGLAVAQPPVGVRGTVSPRSPQITVSPAPAVRPAVPAVRPAVRRDGEYTDRENVASYIVAFGCLPRNFITKAEARCRGWTGGPLERYAPGKSIGGDRFGNYERRLPVGNWRECDIDTRGRPRGAKRLVYSERRHVYYSDDHYRTFRRIR